MGVVTPLTFSEARETVIATVRQARRPAATEEVALLDACSRILAEDVAADRDTPAVSRSVRDGFAVRAVDLPGELEVIGEVRAGERFEGEVGRGQAVEIMTGAPVPDGADAIVMVEYSVRQDGRVRIDRSAEPHQFINPQGCEARANEVVLHSGTRLDYTGVAMLAAFGCARVKVFRRPVVAIIATGDEIVEVEQQAGRNSRFAIPTPTRWRRRWRGPVASPASCRWRRDTVEHTREVAAQAFEADLVLFSGGVSAGKYDVVEEVLAGFGARFLFDRVLIQPGQPLVFGVAGEKVFFGLPGNPSSTMVTFEVFARAAIDLLSGLEEPALHMPYARLTRDFHQNLGLTRFLPARLSADGGDVTPVNWHGSADIPALTRANAFLVSDPDKAAYGRGEWIRVLSK